MHQRYIRLHQGRAHFVRNNLSLDIVCKDSDDGQRCGKALHACGVSKVMRLTLLFWPDQCTMAWLWAESPLRANVELVSCSSSLLHLSDLSPRAGRVLGSSLYPGASLRVLRAPGVWPGRARCVWASFGASFALDFRVPRAVSGNSCARVFRLRLGKVRHSASGWVAQSGSALKTCPRPLTSPVAACGASSLSTSCLARHFPTGWQNLQLMSASTSIPKQSNTKAQENPCQTRANPFPLRIAENAHSFSSSVFLWLWIRPAF